MRAAKHTPILVLTDPLPSDDKAELLRAGANAIIEKPLDLNMCLAQADTSDMYFNCVFAADPKIIAPYLAI